jgi:hypothetical protein
MPATSHDYGTGALVVQSDWGGMGSESVQISFSHVCEAHDELDWHAAPFGKTGAQDPLPQ